MIKNSPWTRPYGSRRKSFRICCGIRIYVQLAGSLQWHASAAAGHKGFERASVGLYPSEGDAKDAAEKFAMSLMPRSNR
jgi:hypothetical protein